MADHIKITKASGTWTVRADGSVLAETSNALVLTEGSYPPVIYFPRDDVAMALLDRTATRSTCPWKGAASYYSVVSPDITMHDAAWSYEAPLPDMRAITGYLAFYPDRVTVEQI